MILKKRSKTHKVSFKFHSFIFGGGGKFYFVWQGGKSLVDWTHIWYSNLTNCTHYIRRQSICYVWGRACQSLWKKKNQLINQDLASFVLSHTRISSSYRRKCIKGAKELPDSFYGRRHNDRLKSFHLGAHCTFRRIEDLLCCIVVVCLFVCLFVCLLLLSCDSQQTLYLCKDKRALWLGKANGDIHHCPSLNFFSFSRY